MTIDLSPETFRALGYRAIDLIAERLAHLDSLPVRQPVPVDLRTDLQSRPLPDKGTDPSAILASVAQEVLAYPMGNVSPGFYAWVNSTPAPLGILADLLAAAHDVSAAGGDHAATYVERAVLNWLKEIMTLPATAAGLLVSGGSMANLTCLTAMRYHMSEGDVRHDGLRAEAQMVVYTSSEGHSCIQKAVEMLGIGSAHLRKIPVDADFRMDVDALRSAIQADRAAGLRPVCVAASAGTVNTGAIDPLADIADVCDAEGLWMHVDGAYGGVGILARQTAGLYDGIERADSIAIDPHKWLYMPIECGCALVRDSEALRGAFSLVPPYLRDDRAEPWFSEFGLQQTRAFRALKIWMVFQQVGVEGYRDLISRDIDTAHALRVRLAQRPDFEIIATGPLSVTCFRYAPAGVPADQLEHLNRRIAAIVQNEGQAFITTTLIGETLTLRACHVNFRTTDRDLDILLDAVQEAGTRLLTLA